MWKFNKTRYLHQFWIGEEIVLSVTAEEWDNFCQTYGGEIYRHNGVSIPVPGYVPFVPTPKLTAAMMEELVLALIAKDRNDV